MMTNSLIKNQLDENLDLCRKALASLEYSVKKCSKLLEDGQERTPEGEESLEALTARFARAVDLFTQKVLKSFFLLLRENVLTQIDKANYLEKLQIIEKRDELLVLRDLRNEIAHEYKNTTRDELFALVLEQSSQLNKIFARTEEYIQTRTKL